MSGGPVCRCGKREAWRVTARLCNYSMFNGGNRTPSDYSAIVCARELGGCGASWRTRASYVGELPDWRAPEPEPPRCWLCERESTQGNPLRSTTGYEARFEHRFKCVRLMGAEGTEMLPLDGSTADW